jgi:starvation-inducible DNA-binding protein
MSKANIGLSSEQLAGSISVLNRVLADEYVLYTKVRKYHWNVKGMQFNDLHKFFQSMYEALDVVVDDVAERVRSLNGDAMGTLAEFSKISRLKEAPGDYPTAKVMIQNLDAGTTDFLTGIMEQHEKTAWMLRSLLAE